MENEAEGHRTAVMEHPRVRSCRHHRRLRRSRPKDHIKLEKLMEKVDSIILGRRHDYTFAAAQGGRAGNSICETRHVPVAREDLWPRPRTRGIEVGHVARRADRPTLSRRRPAPTKLRPTHSDGWEGVDIGIRGQRRFREQHPGRKTILWNGPVWARVRIDKFADGLGRRGRSIPSPRSRALLAHRRRRSVGLHQTSSALTDRYPTSRTGGRRALEYMRAGSSAWRPISE